MVRNLCPITSTSNINYVVWNMTDKEDKETIAELKMDLEDITKIALAIINEIDEQQSEHDHTGCYWWKKTFVESLEVSDKTKAKLGFPPEGYKNNEGGDD